MQSLPSHSRHVIFRNFLFYISIFGTKCFRSLPKDSDFLESQICHASFEIEQVNSYIGSCCGAWTIWCSDTQPPNQYQYSYYYCNYTLPSDNRNKLLWSVLLLIKMIFASILLNALLCYTPFECQLLNGRIETYDNILELFHGTALHS